MISRTISITDYLRTKLLKNVIFLILLLLIFIGYLCDSAPVGGTIDCDAIYHDHPQYGKVFCSTVCPPQKTNEDQKDYCLKNCPVFYNLCAFRASTSNISADLPAPSQKPGEISTPSPDISFSPSTSVGDPALSTLPSDGGGGLDPLVILIPAVIGLAVIIILLVVICCFFRRKISCHCHNGMTKDRIGQQETRSHVDEAEYIKSLLEQRRGDQQ